MNQTPQHTHATAGTRDATPGTSDIRQLKPSYTAAEREQLDRFDRAPRLLRHGATACQAEGYKTGSADFQNGMALLHETDLASRAARTCDRACCNGGWLEPLGSGVRGRARGFDSRRLGLKVNQRTEGVTMGYDVTVVEYGGPTDVETLQNGTREAGLLPAEYFARISPADDGEVIATGSSGVAMSSVSLRAVGLSCRGARPIQGIQEHQIAARAPNCPGG